MAKMRVTAEEFAEKHARRLKASVEDIRAGVERTTESPTAAAAAAQQKMIQNLTAAVQSGKWAQRLRSVSLEEWKEKTITKGLGRIASGIDGAHNKQVAFGAQLLAFESTLKDSIDKMPDLTIEDSIGRATAWMRGMTKFNRK